MIDVEIGMTVSDGTRQFALATRFASDARVIALYGPSGAGKSLTLQAIAGLVKPRCGHVRAGGRVLFDADLGVDLRPERRSIGYLFQHYALFPHLSVRENVAFGLKSWRRRRLENDERLRVDELIERFGLAQHASGRPDGLSGGQRQRVALARALACRPGLLLLDEPFSALDPTLRAGLREHLRGVFCDWRLPVVMITHDVDDVIALADVAFVIEAGRTVREIDVRRGVAKMLAPPRQDPAASVRDAREQRLRALLHLSAAG